MTAWTLQCVAMAGMIAVCCATTALAASSAPAPGPEALYGGCFAETAGRGNGRTKAVFLQFQGLAGGLLAGVVYKLRYGPTFGFSGDCSTRTDGGFLCSACTGATCGDHADTFSILWSGGKSLRLVSNDSGVLAENLDGGRDRFASGVYVLERVAPETCSG